MFHIPSRLSPLSFLLPCLPALAQGLPELQCLRLVGDTGYVKGLDLSPLLTQLPNLWYYLTTDTQGANVPQGEGWIA